MIITLDNINYAYDNCTNVNESTKRIYQCYINKIKQWQPLEFTTQDDLINIFKSHDMSNSQIYSILGLLRCTCVVCNLDDKVKDIVYTLYHDYNKISKNDQYNHRTTTKWTTDSLIEFNKSLQIDSYKTMNVKLLIGLYTLIPPLRNDYNNVKIVTENIDTNFYNTVTGELMVYSTKSKKYHSVTVPVELKDIITETLTFMPRDYLFVTQHKKPFSNTCNMYNILIKLLRTIINDDTFTINTFRHLYATKSFTGTVQDRVAAQEGMLHNAQNHLRYGQ